jgi:hypothetical protein
MRRGDLGEIRIVGRVATVGKANAAQPRQTSKPRFMAQLPKSSLLKVSLAHPADNVCFGSNSVLRVRPETSPLQPNKRTLFAVLTLAPELAPNASG